MPARLRDLIRAGRQWGIVVEPPGSGSHWIARKGELAFPLPCHNGGKSEIDDIYIRRMCRAFGVDEKELRKLM